MSGTGPIFVLGMTPRSGTNLLWDLLRLHPDCAIAREPIWEDNLLVRADLLDAYAERTAASWHDAGAERDDLRRELLTTLGEGLCEFLSTRPDRRLLTKTPHVHHLDRFFSLFPRAYLLVLVRDGRAVVQSSVDTFGGTLEGWARHWAQAADSVLRFDREHAGQRLRYRIVRYEDLVTDRKSQLRELLRFLDLDGEVYDFEAAADLPVRGSSALGRGGGVAWDPVVPGPGFDPTARFSGWGSRRHRRFNWIAAPQLEALGYERRHVGGRALDETGQRLRDAAWAASGPLRALRRTALAGLRGRGSA